MYLCICMNRIVALYMIILYTTFTTGMAVNIHYCAGRVSSVKIDASADKDACGLCSKAKKSGCCHDETKFFKVDDAHSIAVINDVPGAPVSIATVNYSIQKDVTENISSKNILKNHSPPALSPPDIFTRNCVFRI